MCTIGIVWLPAVDEEELKKLGEDLQRSDAFLTIGAVVFAVFAMILAGSLAYVWMTRG